jgi:hypothetical protein
MIYVSSLKTAFIFYNTKNIRNEPAVIAVNMNIHSVLFPSSMFPLSVKAYHVAPPVAIESLILQNETSTVPEDLDSVNVEAGVTLPIVIKFPLVPFKSKSFVKVLVVPAVNNTDAG